MVAKSRLSLRDPEQSPGMQTQLPPELAAAPFSVEQGRKAGLSPGALRSLSLDRPFHGVRRADGDPALFQRCLAYSTRMDSLAFFCGPTAAKLLGVPLPAHLEADE